MSEVRIGAYRIVSDTPVSGTECFDLGRVIEVETITAQNAGRPPFVEPVWAPGGLLSSGSDAQELRYEPWEG